MKKIFLILIILSSMTMFAGEMRIKTSAESNIEVKADTAKINFLIKSSDKDMKKSQSKNTLSMEKFLKEIKDKGLIYDSVSTENYKYNKISEIVKSDKLKVKYNTVAYFKIYVDPSEASSIIESLEKIGEISYKINKNVIEFSIRKEGKSKENNFKEIYSKVDKLTAILKRNFEFVFFENIERTEENREDKYQVETNFSLKLRNIDKINELISIANKYEITLYGNIDYTVSDLNKIYLNMYKESYEKAKKRAQYLLPDKYVIRIAENISEDRYLLADIYNKINIASESKKINSKSYEIASVKNMYMAEDYTIEREVIPKVNLKVPTIKLENNLDIEFIADNGEKTLESGNVNLYSFVQKNTKPDQAEIYFAIDTVSKESMEDSSRLNAKIVNKITEILKLDNISYSKFETTDYDTSKNETKEYTLVSEGNVLNEALLIAEVENISNLNYKQFINILEKNKIKFIRKNDVNYINIVKLNKDLKEAYNEANKLFEILKSEFKKLNIETKLLEYQNNKKEDKKEVVKDITEYRVNHSMKIKTNDFENLSLLISILRNVGVKLSYIAYNVEDISQYEKNIYDELKKDILDKKNSLMQIKDIRIGEIKNIKELDNKLNEKLYSNLYNTYKNNTLNINKPNAEILKDSKDSMENIHVPSYNLNLQVEVTLELMSK